MKFKIPSFFNGAFFFIFISILTVRLLPLHSSTEPIQESQSNKTGLLRDKSGAFKGYTLFTPILSTTTYLIDMKGNVAHSWESKYPPGQAVCLLENGNLLRTATDRGNRSFFGGGAGGRIEEFDWEGDIVWEFVYSNENHMQHHDIEPLPNGNVLLIAWEKRSKEEAIAAGRNPELFGQGEMWADHIVEVKPKRPNGGTIVWEWHAWDHLIQDFDAKKASHGVVAEHPERIDINADASRVRPSEKDRKRLEALGYMRPEPGPMRNPMGSDWLHTNSISYNPVLDQILLSVHSLNEIWVIDHSTTTKEAASHTGGKSGKGGDILYRWGNPRAYRCGTAADQQLFAQHDAQWIPEGMPGAGNITLFNNGLGRPDGNYSSVIEISPPADAKGRYSRKPGSPFGPDKPSWIYTAPEKDSFFSGFISSAQRLPNGNTLICSGEQGRFFEVTQEGKTVWEYVNPFEGNAPPMGPGRGPGFMPGGFPFRPREGNPNGEKDEPREGRPPGRGFPGRGFPGPGMMGRGIFRVTRLAEDFQGFAGRDLKVSKGKSLDPLKK